MSPRLAVFTKNLTNPAYEAARLGADRVATRFGATTVHYVPRQPDSVAEQIALIECAIADRPDAVVFTPVHETAVNNAILAFEAARIPLFNFVTRTTAGQRLCFVGSDDRAWRGTSPAICSRSWVDAEISSLSKAPPRRRQAMRGSVDFTMRLRTLRGSVSDRRCVATTSAMLPAWRIWPRPTWCTALQPSCVRMIPWRWAYWTRSGRAGSSAAGRRHQRHSGGDRRD